MGTQLLITVVYDGSSRTLSYDLASRASLKIALSADAEARASLAHIEAEGAGALLVPERGCSLVTADGSHAEVLALRGSEGTVCSIVSSKLDQPASLYIRPSLPGMRRFFKVGFTHDEDIPIGACGGARHALCEPTRLVEPRAAFAYGRHVQHH